MANKIYFYPVWLRIWHAVNALVFLLLTITGLSMHYGIFGISFKYAVSIHNVSGIILIISYLYYFIANFISGNLRFYEIRFDGLYEGLSRQFKYYVKGILKKEKAPYPLNKKRKFNPLQKLSYVAVMYMILPLIILSGINLLFPQLVMDKVFGVPRIVITDLVHITSGYIGSVFMVVHIYFCTLGHKPSSNFKSMLSGYHEVEEKPD